MDLKATEEDQMIATKVQSWVDRFLKKKRSARKCDLGFSSLEPVVIRKSLKKH